MRSRPGPRMPEAFTASAAQVESGMGEGSLDGARELGTVLRGIFFAPPDARLMSGSQYDDLGRLGDWSF